MHRLRLKRPNRDVSVDQRLGPLGQCLLDEGCCTCGAYAVRHVVRVASYTDLVIRSRVLIPVIERLGLATTPEKLAGSITAISPNNTVLINISVTDTNANMASDIAHATADSVGTQVAALEKPAGTMKHPRFDAAPV